MFRSGYIEDIYGTFVFEPSRLPFINVSQTILSIDQENKKKKIPLSFEIDFHENEYARTWYYYRRKNKTKSCLEKNSRNETTPPRVDDKRTMYNYRLHRSKIIASPIKHTNTNIRTYWFCLPVRSIVISKFTISIIGDRLSLFLRIVITLSFIQHFISF